MRIKKLIIFIIILIAGYVGFEQVPTLLEDNTEDKVNNADDKVDCPQYINEFVANNPQAMELKVNYQSNENNESIPLTVDEGIPLFIQWDKRWAYTRYGDEIIGTAGCGPTSLAMVAVGLTGNTDYNPRYVAKYAIKNGYLDGSMTTWSFMEKGCQAFGLKATAVPLDKNVMINHLEQGKPIICSVRPGDFTTTGHFIVITKTVNGKFIINDPNNKENSKRKWTYEKLSPQIKAMWSYSSL